MASLNTLGAISNENFESRIQPHLWRFAIAASPLIAISALLAYLSDGCYQDDDLAHFLLARAGRGCLIDVWGRPGFTIPYAAVAWVGNAETGWLMSRFLTVAIVGITAWFTSDVARRLRLQQPEVAALLFLATPLSFLLSFTTLTESICGLYLIAGTWLLIVNRNWQSALCWSIAMTTRHEAVVYLVPVGLYFLYRRDLLAAILLGSGEFLWNAVAWAVSLHDIPWRRYVDGQGESGYGSGNIATGLQMWIEAVGPGLCVLALIGTLVLILDLCRQLHSRVRLNSDGNVNDNHQGTDLHSQLPISASGSKRDRRTNEEEVCRAMGTLLVVGGGMGTVALQTVLYMFNRYASGGYARFLVPAAPWIAICAAAGLVRLWSMTFAASNERSPSEERAWHRCGVHLSIALVIGAIIASQGGFQHLFHVDRQRLFFSLAVISGVAIVLARFRFNHAIAITYLLLLSVSGIAWGLEVKPFRKTHEQSLSVQAADWWRTAEEYRDRQIMTNSLWFSLSTGETWCGPEDWASAPTGSLLVYAMDDSAEYNKWLKPDQVPLRTIRQWTSADLQNATKKPRLIIFEKLLKTDVSSAETIDLQAK